MVSAGLEHLADLIEISAYCHIRDPELFAQIPGVNMAVSHETDQNCLLSLVFTGLRHPALPPANENLSVNGVFVKKQIGRVRWTIETSQKYKQRLSRQYKAR